MKSIGKAQSLRMNYPHYESHKSPAQKFTKNRIDFSIIKASSIHHYLLEKRLHSSKVIDRKSRSADQVTKMLFSVHRRRGRTGRRQAGEAEATSDEIYARPAERAREVFQQNPLPGHLSQGGNRHEDRPYREQSSSESFFFFILSLLYIGVDLQRSRRWFYKFYTTTLLRVRLIKTTQLCLLRMKCAHTSVYRNDKWRFKTRARHCPPSK